MIHLIFSIFAVFAAGAAMAQTQPSFDCAQAQSSAEKLICADDDLARLDRHLSDRFTAAVDAAKGLDVGQDAALKGLRATQRGWIKGRDDCWKADDLRDCVEASYLVREAELVTGWLLDTPSAASAYTCENNPANEVFVSFFDTELPSIRLEYGDSIRSGWLVPAASGSKYATQLGGMFWSKGDEAIFVWTEGQEMTCVTPP